MTAIHPELSCKTSTPPAAETHRVLSFRQPYASRIVAGQKWCEIRTWPTNHQDVLLVHTSGRIEKKLPTSAIIGAVWLVDCQPVEDLDACFIQPDGSELPLPEHSAAFRAAVFNALDRLPADVDYIGGPECWIFSAFFKFPEPIPVKGKLNLWKYDLPAGTLPAEWLAEAAATMDVRDARQ